MAIEVGQMRQVVRFERNTPSNDDAGGEVDGFNLFLTTRGRLRKLNGSRGLEAGAVMLDSGYELTVRYQDALADELYSILTVRVVCENRIFTITSYDLEGQKQGYYVMRLNEQSRD